MTQNIEKGYTIAEAAELLGRQQNTIRRYIRTGVLKATKLGNSYIIPAEELRKILQ